MRRTLCVAIAVFALVVQSAVAQSSFEDRTKAALGLVLDRKFAEFCALFTPEMTNAILLETYSAQMNQILALGTPSQGAARVRATGDSTLVAIPLHWKAFSLDFLVSWNKDGQIQGTWMRPPEPPTWQAPPYVRPNGFVSSDVTVGSDEWKLPGTLTIPTGAGPFPAVVLVHGSGPNDRDETVGGAKVFRDLAEGLSSRGIAVLRYEKRTLIYGQKCAADPDFTMTRETVDDAVRAAELLQKTDRVDARRIFVLGHSQGGYMMPRIMKRAPWLAGVIVMAGNVRSLEVLVKEQSEYLGVPAPKLPLPPKYLQDLAGYDPAAEAKKLDMPMLILQGERDYQVTMKDFALWKGAVGGRRNVTMRSYPGLNHLFESGTGKSTPAEYAQPGHVSGQVVEDVAKWVLVP
jgi:hypothetical protein